VLMREVSSSDEQHVSNTQDWQHACSSANCTCSSSNCTLTAHAAALTVMCTAAPVAQSVPVR
jgi:hypothetical protein